MSARFSLFVCLLVFLPLVNCITSYSAWSDLQNYKASFLSGTNSGTMKGYLNSKNGVMTRAQAAVSLPQLWNSASDLNWWLNHNSRCTYCLTLMPDWDGLVGRTSDWYAADFLRTLKAMEARLSLAWPTFCDRSYDRCYLTPNAAVASKLCTRAYCFFNPDKPCSMRGKAARCKSVQWMRDNNVDCPLPCRSLKKRDELIDLLLKRTTSNQDKVNARNVQARALEKMGRTPQQSAASAGSLQLTTLRGKRAYCPYGVSCGNCPTSELSGGCQDVSPITGQSLCCDCFVHPSGQFFE